MTDETSIQAAAAAPGGLTDAKLRDLAARHGCHPDNAVNFARAILSNKEVSAPATAHSKSEYKRRVAMGDPNALPPSAPATAEGWKLVPVEPTEDMLRAAVKSRHGPATFKVTMAVTEMAEAADDYRAMLLAAPIAPAPVAPTLRGLNALEVLERTGSGHMECVNAAEFLRRFGKANLLVVELPGSAPAPVAVTAEQTNHYRCARCGYEGPCYGTPTSAGVSAPWCKQCSRNDGLVRASPASAQGVGVGENTPGQGGEG